MVQRSARCNGRWGWGVGFNSLDRLWLSRQLANSEEEDATSPPAHSLTRLASAPFGSQTTRSGCRPSRRPPHSRASPPRRRSARASGAPSPRARSSPKTRGRRSDRDRDLFDATPPPRMVPPPRAHLSPTRSRRRTMPSATGSSRTRRPRGSSTPRSRPASPSSSPAHPTTRRRHSRRSANSSRPTTSWSSAPRTAPSAPPRRPR